MHKPATESRPARRRLQRDLLTAEELEAILRKCSRRAPTGIRNRAFLTVLYRAGLRLGEAIALEPRDLDPVKGTINVRHGKGDKQRVVAMDDAGWGVLQLWLERRSKLGLNGGRPVFCTLRGAPLQQSYVRTLLPRLARRAGVEKRVHAHGVRHLYATELSREGTPVEHIQRLLGHSSIQTTAVYLSRYTPEETFAYIRRRRWDPPGAPRAQASA